MSISCTLADTPDLKDQVYQLRHACYLRKGAIEPRPDGRFVDPYDEHPNHFSFLLSAESPQPLATVRISVVRPDLGWNSSPARKVFGDHPAFQLMAQGSFVEASRLCFAQQARRDVLMQLIGNMAALADFYTVDWFMACPRVEHTEIYERLFGFRKMAPPRKYFGVSFETALLGVSRTDLLNYTSGVKAMRHAHLNAFARISNLPRCATPAVTGSLA